MHGHLNVEFTGACFVSERIHCALYLNDDNYNSYVGLCGRKRHALQGVLIEIKLPRQSDISSSRVYFTPNHNLGTVTRHIYFAIGPL